MIVEAINKVLSLASPYRESIGGVDYCDRDLKLLYPPRAKTLETISLDGLVNLLETGIDGIEPAALLIHVESWEKVSVQFKAADSYGQRHVPIRAALLDGLTDFAFNSFGDQESFVIALQACFASTPDLATVLDLASHLSSEVKVKLEDSGVAQCVELKRSMAFKEDTVVKARVALAPYRTFREIEQPVSDFIFRVKDGARCALFEADGGAWKLAAINAVSAWLGNRLKTSAAPGLDTIPIIS